MLAIGLMSGTSLDGVDAALVEIEGYGKDTSVKLKEFITLDMPEVTKQRIKEACDERTSSTPLLCSLNFELGYLFSNAVDKLREKAGVSKSQIAFIASHGQTVYHMPYAEKGMFAGTLQIGEPAVIAYEQDTTVVSNFRTMDMAAHGQGAPLVPYSEMLLYGEEGKTIALQNIGGIGNVTVLSKDEVYAFDTGPGNMMMDELCTRYFDCAYDASGKLAAQGVVNEVLLEELMNHPYMKQKPPKTTGREEFGQFYVQDIITRHPEISPMDLLATFTMFTAKSICFHYQRDIIEHTGKLDRAIFGGGGAHNEVLIRHVKEMLPDVEILLQEDLGFSSDAKEAIAFAIMGNETLHHRPSNVPQATGARHPVILGNVTYSPKGENKQ